jgi:hypothetical protein
MLLQKNPFDADSICVHLRQTYFTPGRFFDIETLLGIMAPAKRLESSIT